ncbi:MAG: enoyl-CoA hydratase/isomerase family protein [Acidimicrobiia bacterium]|nr:enoyl-CoA hydratase/isomerase family protein [Acidimicrobiia bacterium]
MAEPTLEIAGPVATIRLQRPDKRNRIEPTDLVRLIELCDDIEADRDVRVAVLTSSGPSFCSGYHLGALAEGTRVEVSFGDLCDRIEGLRIPVIGRLAGNIHGGGTDLAIACDLRIAAEGVHLLMPAAGLGIQYYASGLRRFVEQIGPAQTKRIFCTALPFGADELLRIGYVHEVVPGSELDDRIDAITEAVAALAPSAVAATKAAVNGLASGSLTLAEVEATHRASLRTDDHREALRALREKRPPSFTGG